MEYQRFDNHIVLRIARGEEIIEQLKILSIKEEIKCATVLAIGATNSFTLGTYLVDDKQYLSHDFNENYEITSLLGNITRDGDNPRIHLHASVADKNGHVIGGHMNRAVVSATCEIFIDIYDTIINSKIDETTGLKIFDFKNK